MFEHLRSYRIPSLNLEAQEYRHAGTGARHLHLAANDDNNAFLLAFRTVPQDSTGVAHILEHTVLCGSERFPVRDPFFLMTRRSLNTFMNAFTGSDWTAYVFASQNHKDFDNLLQVYLDAVFFPHLSALDFAQEGHRLELAVPGDPQSELVYKGVVYNEMRGALSSPGARLWHALAAELYPTTTYHHNSGGDPEEIPKLTVESLREFHRRHYHPSNACFGTYGDFDPREHQAKLEEWALRRFEARPVDGAIGDERRYTSPRGIALPYALSDTENTEDRTHIVLGWLLGRTQDLRSVLEMHLLCEVLLNNSAAPLRHALETTALGAAPSELCGLDTGHREAVFVCGLEGSNPERAEEVEGLCMGVIREVVEQGIDQELVDSVLHQMELDQREVSGGSYPYGLQLLSSAIPMAMHGGDPIAALDLDAVIEDLRIGARDPGFVPGLARRWLLDNPHRVRVVMTPDTGLFAREAKATRERLADVRAALLRVRPRAHHGRERLARGAAGQPGGRQCAPARWHRRRAFRHPRPDLARQRDGRSPRDLVRPGHQRDRVPRSIRRGPGAGAPRSGAPAPLCKLPGRGRLWGAGLPGGPGAAGSGQRWGGRAVLGKGRCR